MMMRPDDVLDDMVEPLLVIGPVDAHGDGSCDVV